MSDGCEVDTDTDPDHCGNCGTACGVDGACHGGACCTESAVTDQSVTAMGTYLPMSPGNVWAQTFTAGVSGLLTQVSLALSTELPLPNQTPTPGDLTVEIRTTVAGTAGVSNGYDYSTVAKRTIPTSVVLASEVILAGSIPDYPPSSDIVVKFSAPATVTKGTVYAIAISATGTARHDWTLHTSHNADGYAGGSIFVSTSTGWNDYGYQPNLSSTGGVDYYDGAFKTVVFGCPGY